MRDIDCRYVIRNAGGAAYKKGWDGYQAVARARDKRIRGIIVVPKDSPIESLAELDGKELAFPAPAGSCS